MSSGRNAPVPAPDLPSLPRGTRQASYIKRLASENIGQLLPTTTYTLNPQMGHPVGTTTGIQKGKERKEKEREDLR